MAFGRPEDPVYAAIGILVLVASVPLGATMLATNRRLLNVVGGTYLVATGINFGLYGLWFVIPDAWWRWNAFFYSVILVFALVPVYLVFVGQAIQTRWTAFLRTRTANILLSSSALAFIIIATTAPTFVIERPGTSDPFAAWVAYAFWALPFVFLYPILCSIAAFAGTPRGTPTRTRAGLYALGFGLIDVSFVLTGAAVAVQGDTLQRSVDMVTAGVAGLFTLAGVLVLAYAVLRYQLLDIDLKLKWTLRRGTLVGAFVGAFVVVAAVVEQWLQQYGVLVGGVAVGLMLLALRPLERAADRLADAAMPRVRDTEEYRVVRKREVYRAALEEALVDGVLTQKDRGVLAALAQQVGLGAKDAHDIEREVEARRGGAD